MLTHDRKHQVLKPPQYHYVGTEERRPGVVGDWYVCSDDTSNLATSSRVTLFWYMGGNAPGTLDGPYSANFSGGRTIHNNGRRLSLELFELDPYFAEAWAAVRADPQLASVWQRLGFA